jgi:CrcB protein
MWNCSVTRTVVAISLGAIAGALCRFYLGTWLTQLLGSDIPYGTMLINLTGCFVMGFFATFSLMRVITIHPDVRLMATTGFLGSYTTFSSYELDAAKLVTRSLESDLMYWGGTILLGLVSLQLGIALAERFRTDESHNN